MNDIAVLISFDEQNQVNVDWILDDGFTGEDLCDVYFQVLSDKFTQVLTQSILDLQTKVSDPQQLQVALKQIAQKYMGQQDQGGILHSIHYPTIG